MTQEINPCWSGFSPTSFFPLLSILDLHKAQTRTVSMSAGKEQRRFTNIQLGRRRFCQTRMKSSPGVSGQNDHWQGAVWQRSEELPQPAVQLPDCGSHFLVLHRLHIGVLKTCALKTLNALIISFTESAWILKSQIFTVRLQCRKYPVRINRARQLRGRTLTEFMMLKHLPKQLSSWAHTQPHKEQG